MTAGEGEQMSTIDATLKIVYWHRDLPPLDAEPIGEHTVEATSGRVPGTMAHRDDLWRVCHENLMAQAEMRVEQEVARLGGQYARVYDEAIDGRHDDVSDEAWLHGRFGYVLYRHQRGTDDGARKPQGRVTPTDQREALADEEVAVCQ
jgi:hypothetical protein